MSSQPKFSALAIAPCYRDYTEENKALAPLGVEVKEVCAHGDAAQLKQLLVDADVVFLRDSRLDADVIAQMQHCKGIVRYGVGVDTIDLNAASAKKIKVANVPDYGAEIEVADHAAALSLALLRRIVSRHQKVMHDGLWRIDQNEPIGRIAERKLGLIGFGKIAKAYLSRMRCFGITEVVAYDPFVDEAVFTSLGVTPVDLPTLCRTADLISLHAPATTENRHCINAQTLALMGKNTALINTSRGALIDETSLVRAVQENRIFGVALDVQECEPMAANSPLHALRDKENVILTNHIGWYSEASIATLQRKAGEQAYQILAKGEPVNWVNRW